MRSFRIILGITFLLGFLSLSGCGNAVSSTSATSPDAGNAYAGTTLISGLITAQSSDLQQVQPSAAQASLFVKALSEKQGLSVQASILSSEQDFGEGKARLYEILEDGSLVYTNIETEIVTGSYSFKNVKDGKKYLVEAYKTGVDPNGNPNILKQRAYVGVDQGVNVATSDISSDSGIVAQYLIQNVFKETSSTKIPETDIKKIIDQAKLSKDNFIQNGVIVPKSKVIPIQSGTPTNSYVAYKPDLLPEDEKYAPEKLSSVVNIEETKQKTFYEKLKTAPLEEAKNIFKKANQASLDVSQSNSPEDFYTSRMIDLLCNEAIDDYQANKKISIRQIAQAYYLSLGLPVLKQNITTQNIENFIINGALIGSNSSYGLTSRLTKLYAYYDSAVPLFSNQPTADWVALFPKSAQRLLPLSPDTQLDIMQAFQAFTSLPFYSSNVSNAHFIPDSYKSTTEYAANSSNGQLVTKIDLLRFFVELGLKTDLPNASKPVQFVDLSAIGLRVWKQNGTSYEEVDAIDARVGVVADSSQSVSEVWLEYTKEDGTVATANMAVNTAVSFVYKNSISPSETQNPINSIDRTKVFSLNPYGNPGLPSIYISDFKSGTIKFLAVNSSKQILASQVYPIVKWNLPARPWVFPAGINMLTRPDLSYVTPTVSIEVGQLYNPILNWEKPAIAIPNNMSLVYDLKLTKISNTPSSIQPEQLLVQTNTVNLNKGLSINIPNEQYEFTVAPMLIDNTTKKLMWRGAESKSALKIQQNSTNWSATINGTVRIPQAFKLPLGSNAQPVSGTWKIGLFKINGVESNIFKNYFFELNNTAPRQAVVSTNLVINDQSLSNGFYTSAYSLTGLTKINMSVNQNYQLVVWFEQSQSANGAVWANRVPQKGIDFDSTGKAIEPMYVYPPRLFQDPTGLVIESISTGRELKSLLKSENQKIDITSFDWVK